MLLSTQIVTIDCINPMARNRKTFDEAAFLSRMTKDLTIEINILVLLWQIYSLITCSFTQSSLFMFEKNIRGIG